MKPFKLGDKSWKKARVLDRLDERSYDVEDDDGSVYRRNRVHLRQSAEADPPTNTANQQPTAPPTITQNNSAPPEPSLGPRKSSRSTKGKLPSTLKDFVTYK